MFMFAKSKYEKGNRQIHNCSVWSSRKKSYQTWLQESEQKTFN